LAGLRGCVPRDSRSVTTFYPCRLEAEHHMLLAQMLMGARLEGATKLYPRAARGETQVGNGRSNQPEA
jgi:hypothetical protein